MLFEDDCFRFSKAGIQARNMMDILKLFGDVSGQVINLQKSGIYLFPKIHKKHCKIISLKLGRYRKMINT